MARFSHVLPLTFVTIGMAIVRTGEGLILHKTKENTIDWRVVGKHPGRMMLLLRIATKSGLIQLALFWWQLEKIPGTSRWKADSETALLRLGLVKPDILSWSPRIILFHNFLSMEECDYLIAISRPYLRPSAVVDPVTGKASFKSLKYLYEEQRYRLTAQAVEKRISVFSLVPQENGEPIQIVRYQENQFYNTHFDYFSDNKSTIHGGQRVATMLMYLSDNVEGGETYFPKVGSGNCSCGGNMHEGFCLQPKKGDALLFWSMVDLTHYMICMVLTANQIQKAFMEVVRLSKERSS